MFSFWINECWLQNERTRLYKIVGGAGSWFRGKIRKERDLHVTKRKEVDGYWRNNDGICLRWRWALRKIQTIKSKHET